MRARRHLTLLRSWTVVACLVAACPPTRAAARSVDLTSQQPAAEEAPAAPWPCRLVVANDLLPHVRIAWERSPTFRQQCARIARAGAFVLLRTATSAQARRPAQARIGVSADGVTIAHVLVRLSADSVEHIGHELEHLVEHLDKVNLRDKREVHRSGVTASSVGYESDRAIDAGRRVAREVRTAGRRRTAS